MTTNANGDTVVHANCHEVPDWWQFQGVRRWLGQHPKTVKTGFVALQAVTVISSLADDGASLLALPEEEAAEAALLEGIETAAQRVERPLLSKQAKQRFSKPEATS
jgi:hypothetical protein